MICSVSVRLSQEDIQEYAEFSTREREKWIESLFVALDDDEQKRLLTGFCTSDRESFDDASAIVNDVTIDDDGNGSLDIGFTGSTYMGCRDMDIEHEHDEVVAFILDRDRETMEFSTDPPDHGERPSDDI